MSPCETRISSVFRSRCVSTPEGLFASVTLTLSSSSNHAWTKLFNEKLAHHGSDVIKEVRLVDDRLHFKCPLAETEDVLRALLALIETVNRSLRELHADEIQGQQVLDELLGRLIGSAG